jgi:hypothetical protein
MILAIFCIVAATVGALLHLCFHRFSWLYLVVSILISAVGFEAVRFALGEVKPFLPNLEYIIALIVWEVVPWFLFAFLPLQLGYVAARCLASRFSQHSASADNPH